MGHGRIEVYDNACIIAGIKLSFEREDHNCFSRSHDYRDIIKALEKRGFPENKYFGFNYETFCNDDHVNDIYFGRIIHCIAPNEGVDITDSKFEKELKKVSEDLPDSKIFLVHSHVTWVEPP